jgi:hypothetical protein
MNWQEFQQAAKKAGLTAAQTSGDHGEQWQVQIPGMSVILNFYPNSAKKTLIVDRRGEGVNQALKGHTAESVIEFATRLRNLRPEPRPERVVDGTFGIVQPLTHADAVDLVAVYGGDAVKVEEDGPGDWAAIRERADGTVVAFTCTGVGVYASRAQFLGHAPPLAIIPLQKAAG